MEQIFPHRIEYTNQEQFSLKDISDSLLAQQALVDYLPKLLSELLPGLEVGRVKIALNSAKTGSLKQEFWVAFFLSFQSELQDEVTDLVTMLTGVNVPEEYDTLVTLLILLVVLYGSKFVWKKFRGDTAPAPSQINGNYNTILNLTATTINIEPEAISKAVEKSVSSRSIKKITQATSRFFRPAKKGGAAAIQSGGTELITEEAVREYPSEAELSIDNENDIEAYPDVKIEILALDRQKRGVGWAGRFPDGEIESKRLAMDLSPTIELENVSTAKFVQADTVVEFKKKNDETIPWKIHLVRIIKVIE